MIGKAEIGCESLWRWRQAIYILYNTKEGSLEAYKETGKIKLYLLQDSDQTVSRTGLNWWEKELMDKLMTAEYLIWTEIKLDKHFFSFNFQNKYPSL